MANLSPAMLIKLFLFFQHLLFLCICQQPDNSDLFKGHGSASTGVYELIYIRGGSSPSGDKAQMWRVKRVWTSCRTIVIALETTRRA